MSIPDGKHPVDVADQGTAGGLGPWWTGNVPDRLSGLLVGDPPAELAELQVAQRSPIVVPGAALVDFTPALLLPVFVLFPTVTNPTRLATIGIDGSMYQLRSLFEDLAISGKFVLSNGALPEVENTLALAFAASSGGSDFMSVSLDPILIAARIGSGPPLRSYRVALVETPSTIDLMEAVGAAEGDITPQLVNDFMKAYIALRYFCDGSIVDKYPQVGDNVMWNDVLQLVHRTRRMAEHEPTSQEVIDSVIEQVRNVSDPLGRIGLIDALQKDLPPALVNEGYSVAEEFRARRGTWADIGRLLDISRQTARQRFDRGTREAHVETLRRRRAQD